MAGWQVTKRLDELLAEVTQAQAQNTIAALQQRGAVLKPTHRLDIAFGTSQLFWTSIWLEPAH